MEEMFFDDDGLRLKERRDRKLALLVGSLVQTHLNYNNLSLLPPLSLSKTTLTMGQAGSVNQAFSGKHPFLSLPL